jgi:hypothetical protein
MHTMRNLLLGILGSAAIAVPALAALEAGDTAPNFEAKASLAGKPFDYSLREALDKGPVVVYFYPSAYTRGCNIQAAVRQKQNVHSNVGIPLREKSQPDFC